MKMTNRKDFIKGLAAIAVTSCVSNIAFANELHSIKHFVSDCGDYTLDADIRIIEDIKQMRGIDVEKEIQEQLNALKFWYFVKGRYVFMIKDGHVALKHSDKRYGLYNDIAMASIRNMYELESVAIKNMETFLHHICDKATRENIVDDPHYDISVEDNMLNIKFSYKMHNGKMIIADFKLGRVPGKWSDVFSV